MTKTINFQLCLHLFSPGLCEVAMIEEHGIQGLRGLTVKLKYIYIYFTFEHRSQFPHSKTSNRGILTKSRLQKEQGHASKYERQKVGNQEGPWMRGEKQRCVNADKPHTINTQYNPVSYLAGEVFCFRLRSRSQHGYLAVRNYARLWGGNTLKIALI